jgi:hypothetical protein
MMEVFTKSFWQGVKKTFDQALEEPPQAQSAVLPPATDDPSAPSTSPMPSSSATPSPPAVPSSDSPAPH